MPFGSRRSLTSGIGRLGGVTEILFKGSIEECTIAEISNDSNGNTVLGNGSFNSNSHLPSSAGTGGFPNAPMVVELTPGRVYIIKIIRDQSGGTGTYVPQILTNVDPSSAPRLDVFYGNVTRLSNPPEQDEGSLLSRIFRQADLGSGEPVLSGPAGGDGNPTPPAQFTFDNAGWVNNEIVLAEGFSVPNSHGDGIGGVESTPKGLYCRFNVQQSSNGATARVKVTVQEGFLQD